ALLGARAGPARVAEGAERRLLGGGIAYADRTRIQIAGKVVQLALVSPPLARDPVGHLQLLRRSRRAAVDESPEMVGLLLVAELRERPDREGGIADPAVAVVPI